jgi:hypothetical protein
MLKLDKKVDFKYTEKHLFDICEYPHLIGHIAGKTLLTELHSRWINYMWNDGNVDLSLQAHRGSYKTTAICAVGAVYWLLFHPNDRIAIVRKTFTDAADVVSTIAQMMSLPDIRNLFAFAHREPYHFTIKKYGKLTFSFKKTITPEGSITAHGLDLGLTGKHYDKIICDDIITLKDRVSKAERDKTKNIIREIRTNIIDPGKSVIWIGTPWHKNDAWTILPEPLKYGIWDCGILTNEEILRKKKSTTPSLWAANYELKHIADDNLLFKDARYGRWDFGKNKNALIKAITAIFLVLDLLLLVMLKIGMILLNKNMIDIGVNPSM